jgi:hypothetical protein
MSALRALLTIAVTVLVAACNHAAPEPAGSTPTDAGTRPAPTDASVACFTNPTTYLEIINACTDAQAIDKVVDLSPMSSSDGGLRPLP